MSSRINEIVSVSPSDWPGVALDVMPGDLSQFAPIGLGLSPPLVVRPWDHLEDVFSRPNFYGSQGGPTSHPFADAPINDSSAGTVYFDGRPDRSDVESLLRLLEVRVDACDYAVFMQDSDNTLEDRFLTQLRVVCRWGLSSLFQVSPESVESLAAQPIAVGELIWRFIQDQQQTWGTGMGSKALRGVMGGDGDWAKESLAFGLMVENAYHGVYRIWSRAWLVTK
ncbi:MAG: hypothetical protein DWQ31_21065 [Planctomycetota bacterium]|nr:MAG: hypothetical protein DWQ31_21065 [Planctomycetota bacterium]REJ97133.1 MAG: hypothetical protein DWQ35_02640 [Planctomycetota bacterium]REK27942.1 MAG: hypothetical protein DWQ42_05920 [Planctomycetota bacterium]REK42254.1 MAG: hypothetical protein DWQ46_14045 [Planctomycetota bacterium]